MPTYLNLLGVGFVLGIGAIVVFFVLGSSTGSGLIGIISFCVASLLGGFILVRWHRKALWYSSAVINLPMWLFLIGPADSGQFQLYFNGLLVALVTGYLGGMLGLKLPKRSNDVQTSDS